MGRTRRLGALLGAAGLVAGLAVHLQPAAATTTTFTATGTAAVITSGVNAFQAALGGANNGTAPPPQATGFRRINWDGVPVTGDNAIEPGKVGDVAPDLFQPRGVVLSDDNAVANDGFASVSFNGSTSQFPAFTTPNIFAPYGDNQVEVNFVLASARGAAAIPAASKGFGVVFQDVEQPGTTIEYFKGSTSLGVFNVPVGASSGQQSFLGVIFDTPRVTRAVITLGTARIFDVLGSPSATGVPTDAVGTDGNGEGDDLVTADDFIYGEPMCTRTLGAVTSPSIVAADGDVVCLNGTTVNGSVLGSAGSTLVVNNAFVTGNVTSTGGAFVWLCGSTVRGAVAVQNSTGFARIGDAANDDGLGCAPNNIRGSVSVLNGRGNFEIGGNQVGGNVTANDNSFGRVIEFEARPAGTKLQVAEFDVHEIEGNVIGGQLTCLRNFPPVTFDEKPNTVTGTVNCVTSANT